MTRHWTIIALLLVAAFFRAQMLSGEVRFHPDEAFFAAFARNAAVRGEWLLPGDLDKTPLTIYAQAVAMLLTGITWDGAVWRLDVQQGEFAARLPGFYSGVLLVAVMAAVSRRLRAGMLPVVLVALSPVAIVFAPTAFTDTPMVLCVMLAVLFALRGHGAWAGVWLAVAYACKQQAVLFVPLVVLLLLSRRDASWPRPYRRLAAFAVAAGAMLLPLFIWELLRPYPAITALATANNAPEQWLVPVDGLWPRALAWLNLTRWWFGGAVGVILVVFAGVGWARHGPSSTHAGAITIFLIGYALLHWLVPLNIYDRYVFAVLPLVALVIGLVLPRHWIVCVLVGALMVPGAWQAATGQIPVGGDRGDHATIIQLADYLNSREFGAIVYDRWLGWELNYYLGGWSDRRRAYYPTVTEMTADPEIYVADVAPRYLPAPHAVQMDEWLAALHAAGFESCVGYRDDLFTVYVLTHPPGGDETSASALAEQHCRSYRRYSPVPGAPPG